MADLPSIGDLVTLRDRTDLHYSSRVEDVAGGVVVVARPADLKAALVYDYGLELDLIWTQMTGIHVLPTKLAGTSTHQHLRLWHLEITGGSHTEQRRDYVRVTLSGTVTLEADDEAPDTAPRLLTGPLTAQFIDLSEVAFQAMVTLSPDEIRIQEHTAVRCRFALGGFDFDLRGTVIIVRPGLAAHEQRIVIRFDASKGAGDALRKEVFAIQLAQRRNNS